MGRNDVKDLEARRRGQILRAVRECVAEAGYGGTTMRRIAEKAGISTGMLTYYYANKREMILAALTTTDNLRYERSREIGGAESNPRRVAAYFDVAFADHDGELSPWPFTLEYWAAATRDAELREHHLGRHREGREQMAGHVRAAMAAGNIRDDVDPYALAEVILALRKGLGAEIAIQQGDASVRHARELAEFMLSLLRPGSNDPTAKSGASAAAKQRNGYR